jgi:hypothetical protein
MRSLLWALFIVLIGTVSSVRADERDGRLDIYFIDVEGGAATLFVTPAGETMLIDSGYPDYGGRDRDRILKVVKEVAEKSQIDHAVVSHWHLDHYGNHAALTSQIKIGQFWDRGIPESLMEDDKFAERIVQYRAASQNKSKAVKVGDALPLKSAATPLSVKVVTASGEVLPNEGPMNPFRAERRSVRQRQEHQPAAVLRQIPVPVLRRSDLEYRSQVDDAAESDRPGGSVHGDASRAGSEQQSGAGAGDRSACRGVLQWSHKGSPRQHHRHVEAGEIAAGDVSTPSQHQTGPD